MTDYTKTTAEEHAADPLQIAADQAEERAQQDEETRRTPEENPNAKYRPKTQRVCIDVTGYPVNSKGNAIVSDEFFMEHYKELPNGTVNESGNKRAFSGGYVKTLTDEDRIKGGQVRQQQKEKVETFAAAIKRALYSKAPKKTCQDLGLDLDSSMLECIVSAQALLATDTAKNSTKAAEFLRDTIGEKPADRQEISADIITAEERALLEKVNARLTGSEQAATGSK